MDYSDHSQFIEDYGLVILIPLVFLAGVVIGLALSTYLDKNKTDAKNILGFDPKRNGQYLTPKHFRNNTGLCQYCMRIFELHGAAIGRRRSYCGAVHACKEKISQ